MRKIWEKRLLPAVAAAALAALLCAAPAAQELPEEVPPRTEAKISAWAAPEVAAAREAGWLSEEELGEDYTLPITRAQYARMAVRFIAAQRGVDAETLLREYGLDDPAAESPFSDTADPDILLAEKLGIVKGDSGGTFRPEGHLTRAEAAMILQRCMGLLGRSEANAAPKVFSDAYLMPRWAVEAIKFSSGRTTAEGAALMTGSGGAFRPGEDLSVEQAVLTLVRCGRSAAVEGVYEGWRAAPGYDTVEITLSFGGDCTFGRMRGGAYAGSFDEMYDKMGPAYFFSNVEEFHTDDLTMVNFEGALTTADTPREDKEFIFKAGRNTRRSWKRALWTW